jgi:hypothetical protein
VRRHPVRPAGSAPGAARRSGWRGTAGEGTSRKSPFPSPRKRGLFSVIRSFGIDAVRRLDVKMAVRSRRSTGGERWWRCAAERVAWNRGGKGPSGPKFPFPPHPPFPLPLFPVFQNFGFDTLRLGDVCMAERRRAVRYSVFRYLPIATLVTVSRLKKYIAKRVLPSNRAADRAARTHRHLRVTLPPSANPRQSEHGGAGQTISGFPAPQSAGRTSRTN